MSDLIKLYGEEYVKGYHQTPGQRLSAILRHVNFSPDDKIFDVGCGNGLLYECLKGKVANYEGVDFSEAFIADCRKRFSDDREAKFHCVSVEEFSAKHPGLFSKAFMLDVTEHVPDDELLPMFKSVRSSLVVGGELFIHTPNRDYFMEKLKARGILKQITGHVAVRNFRQYQSLLRSAGFSEVRLVKLPHYEPLPMFFHFLSHVPIIGQYFLARILVIATA